MKIEEKIPWEGGVKKRGHGYNIEFWGLKRIAGPSHMVGRTSHFFCIFSLKLCIASCDQKQSGKWVACACFKGIVDPTDSQVSWGPWFVHVINIMYGHPVPSLSPNTPYTPYNLCLKMHCQIPWLTGQSTTVFFLTGTSLKVSAGKGRVQKPQSRKPSVKGGRGGTLSVTSFSVKSLATNCLLRGGWEVPPHRCFWWINFGFPFVKVCTQTFFGRF